MLAATGSFISRLEAKVAQQLGSQRVGFLLGAGASFLGGKGYPLAGKLWDCIGPKLPKPERDEIQAVVSQRPHELSETVLAQCGTFLCLRITNPDDQSYVRSLVPEGERGLVDILAGLGRGECLALGEAVPLPTRFKFNKPAPFPNSEDIDFYSKWKDGPDDINVESIVDRWRKQQR